MTDLLLLLHSLSFWQIQLTPGLNFDAQRENLETLVYKVMKEDSSVQVAHKALSNAKNGGRSHEAELVRQTPHGVCKAQMHLILSILTMTVTSAQAATGRFVLAPCSDKIDGMRKALQIPPGIPTSYILFYLFGNLFFDQDLASEELKIKAGSSTSSLSKICREIVLYDQTELQRGQYSPHPSRARCTIVHALLHAVGTYFTHTSVCVLPSLTVFLVFRCQALQQISVWTDSACFPAPRRTLEFSK